MSVVEKREIFVSKVRTPKFNRRVLVSERVNAIGYTSKTVLETYYQKGCLDYLEPEYKAIDLLSAGQRLFNDWQLAQELKDRSVRERVDQSLKLIKFSTKDDAFDRYKDALNSIYKDYSGIVRRVVIEDLLIVANDNRVQIAKYKVYQQKVDLCRGLAELSNFYKK